MEATSRTQPNDPAAVIRRFEWLGKLTLGGFVLMLPAVMYRMPYFDFGHQAAVAFELAGIAVMSGALIVGSLGQLRQWWRQLGSDLSQPFLR